MTTHPACSYCGAVADGNTEVATGRPLARMDLDTVVCVECSTLEPARAGSVLRAAARVLGATEEDPFLHEALKMEAGALDGLLFSDPGDPLRAGRRPPQGEPWRHVPRRTREALRRAQARGRELSLQAARAASAPAATAPPSGPSGCLLCGVGSSASWRLLVTSALTPGPDHVEGHLCAACSVAYDRVGAVGSSLVEQAWLVAAGVTWPAGCRLPTVRAWVATGLPPGEPWGWVDLRPSEPEPKPAVAELAALVAELRAEVAELRGRGGR